jgi:ribosomal protein S18 acetylase RimI-like enzyme
MPATIRTATEADLPTLRAFEQGVIAAERAFDPTIADDPVRYYDFDRLLKSRDSEVVVAELDGEIVGSGYVRIDAAEPFLRHRHHGYLGFMYVRPEYRGRGINGLVVEALERWAKGRGLTELRLEVFLHNRAAVRAYERAGFTEHLLEMRKPI